jgi:hypothetical protein
VGDATEEVRDFLAQELDRMAAAAGLDPVLLPGFEPRDGGYAFIELGGGGELRLRACERGRLVRELVTHDPRELLYWALRDASFEAAGRWAARNRQRGEAYRVTLWRRQFAMLHALEPEWAARRRTELIDSLPTPEDVALVPDLPRTLAS